MFKVLRVAVVCCLIALFWFDCTKAQDLDYAKEVINELCSEVMAGRGYVNEGDNAAAFYIEEEFQKHRLDKWNFDYNQEFQFPVNSFPGELEVRIDDKKLTPGTDYIVAPSCPSVKVKLPILRVVEPP